jgi:hypothetical protein
MDQRQQNVIEYLREENRVLREQRGERRLRFTDNQRRRLAVRLRAWVYWPVAASSLRRSTMAVQGEDPVDYSPRMT